MSDFLITLIIASILAIVLILMSKYDAEKRRMSRALNTMGEGARGVNNLNNESLLEDACPTDNLDSDFADTLKEYMSEGPEDRISQTQEMTRLSAEQRTRALIGDENYNKMSSNVDRLLQLHRADRSITVQLTAGPDTAEGGKELHQLLPGDPLWLRKSVEGGMDVVDVYSGGFRIGRLLLNDADKVIDIMSSAVITGSYVAEQNCYGESEDIALGIIVFHSTQQEYEARRGADARPWMITIEGPQRIVLYQN